MTVVGSAGRSLEVEEQRGTYQSLGVGANSAPGDQSSVSGEGAGASARVAEEAPDWAARMYVVAHWEAFLAGKMEEGRASFDDVPNEADSYKGEEVGAGTGDVILGMEHQGIAFEGEGVVLWLAQCYIHSCLVEVVDE